jgi:Carboxypeptidase regulatory-like domain
MERRLLMFAVTVALLAACGGSSSSTTAAGGTLTGQVLAGPTCPVETTPPDSNCAPRPVVGAVLVVRDLAGETVAEIISDGDGRFDAALPAGSYTLVPQPVDGLMGTGESQDFTIEAGAATTIDVAYDTGIR